MLTATKPKICTREIVKKSGAIVARVIAFDGWILVANGCRIFARYGTDRTGWDVEGYVNDRNVEALLVYMEADRGSQRLLKQALWFD